MRCHSNGKAALTIDEPGRGRNRCRQPPRIGAWPAFEYLRQIRGLERNEPSDLVEVPGDHQKMMAQRPRFQRSDTFNRVWSECAGSQTEHGFRRVNRYSTGTNRSCGSECVPVYAGSDTGSWVDCLSHLRSDWRTAANNFRATRPSLSSFSLARHDGHVWPALLRATLYIRPGSGLQDQSPWVSWHSFYRL